MLRPALAALVAVALAAAAVLAPTGAAFSAGPHDDITRAAARRAGFPDGGLDALLAAVRAPDAEDSRTGLGADGIEFGRSAAYRPFHHCERIPPEPDADAFNATVLYIGFQGGVARNASLDGDPDGAVRALGQALHALEDCFAHSNAIDLPEPTAVVHAVVGNVPPPAGLRLTSVQPEGDDPERPAGDDYTHGEFAKDNPDKNDESRLVMADNRTKFEAARDLATDAATLFLQTWLDGRNAAELGPLGEADAPAGGMAPRWAPAASVALVAAALVWAAVLLRRR